MQHMVGLSQADIAALRDQVETMLTGEGVSPSAPFGDFALFGNAMVTGARHRCVLLPFDAIAAAFDALAAREPDAERG
jgi:NifU-like protein involved in Fe-S cluster formation